MKKTNKNKSYPMTVIRKKDTRGRKSSRGRKKENPVMMTVKAPARAAKKVSKNIDPDMIAKGAAMMAVAAGMVATGAVLSQEKNRKKIGHAAKSGMRSFGEIVNDLSEQARDHYPAIAHQIPGVEKKKPISSKKPSKRKSSGN